MDDDTRTGTGAGAGAGGAGGGAREAEAARAAQALRRALTLGAAALAGLGAIFFLAANWPAMGRLARFGVIEALLAVGVALAVLFPRQRAAGAMLALLAAGGLLALFGQTYPTGAPAWQLFALWAAFGLPIAFGARSDVVGSLWALVALAAVATSLQGNWPWERATDDLSLVLAGAAASAIVAGLGAPWRAWTGTGPWSLRTAAVLGAVAMTLAGAARLLGERELDGMAFVALAVLGAGVAWSARAATRDLVAASACALGVDTLLVVLLARILDVDRGGAGVMFLVGLAALAIVGATAHALVRLARLPVPEAAPEGGTDTHRDDAAPASASSGAASGAPSRIPVAADDARPWPIVLVTALGAWLAVVPLLAVVMTITHSFVGDAVGPFVLGGGLLVLAVIGLRQRAAPVFVEQALVPVLLTGLGLIAFGLYRDAHDAAAPALLMAGVLTAMAAVVDRQWLRWLLGAGTAAFAGSAFQELLFGPVRAGLWYTGHVLLLPGLGALAALAPGAGGGPRAEDSSRAGGAAFAGGWVVLALGVLVGHAGATFLVSPALGDGGTGDPFDIVRRSFGLVPVAGSLIAAAGAGVIAWRASPVRGSPLLVGPVVVALALSGFLPLLGGAVLAAAVALGLRNGRLAIVAALAALWITGSFYYALGWTLTTKAAVMAGLGLALGAFVRFVPVPVPAREDVLGATPARGGLPLTALGAPALGIALGALACATFVDVEAVTRQHAFAQGETVLVALAPVDPRSPMQGDYLRLAWRLPDPVQRALVEDGAGRPTRRPQVVARRDEQGVAVVERLRATSVSTGLLRREQGEPLAPGEFAMDVQPMAGRWGFGSDRWFIPEGTGERYAGARYGVFRVAADGAVQLQGLADSERRGIEP